MNIRRAQPADHAAIRACVDAAFGQPLEARLVEALREAGEVEIELVAAGLSSDGLDLPSIAPDLVRGDSPPACGGAGPSASILGPPPIVAGHILLSRLVAPERSLALAPLSVLPTYQRMGIGSALVRQASDLAAAAGWAAVFVLGDPRYYGRFDYSVSAAARFKTPYAQEHTAALALDPETFASLGGALVYPTAFAAFA